MNELVLQDLYIYPIKSLGGIAVTEAEVQQTGLKYDRRWMLTDGQGTFMSQRVYPQMAMLQVNIVPEGLLVTHKRNVITPLIVPFEITAGTEVTVSVWDDVCTAIEASADASNWFSTALNHRVRLVYMPDTTQRLVDNLYAGNNETVSFADAYPFLIIGQPSLNDLNNRLREPVLMNRFRPNIVFSGGTPYLEDSFDTFQIGDVTFAAVKPCARCVLTTIDQESGTKGTEPLKTLSTYRASKNKVLFGQNLVHSGSGTIKVGDRLTVQKWKK